MAAQGSTANAKEDTVIYLDSGVGSSLAEDLSQYATDLVEAIEYVSGEFATFGRFLHPPLYGASGLNDASLDDIPLSRLGVVNLNSGLIVGRTTQFDRLEIEISTAFAGGGIEITPKYYKSGGGFAAIPGAVSDIDYTQTGTMGVSFTPPADWVTYSSNYVLFLEVTSLTAPTTTLPRASWVELFDAAPSGAVYETSSARGSITGETGREIYVRWSYDEETDAIAAAHHAADLSDQTWAIGTNGSAAIVLVQNNTTLWSLANPGAADLSISWSTRPNPDTTGSGDALLSEVVIYDHDASEYLAIEQLTHPVPTTSTSWTISVGGVWNGSAMQSSPGTMPTKFRLSAAWHPHAEMAEDWIAARAAHSHQYPQTAEPIGVGADVGAKAGWAGQPNAGFVAGHANELRGKLLSPLIAETYREATNLSGNTWTSSSTRQRWMPAPGGTELRLDVTKLRKLNVRGIRWAHVRVQLQAWVITGSAVPVLIRCYAMNRPHIGLGVSLEGEPMPTLKYQHVQAKVTDNHGSSGLGEWYELGPLQLPALEEPIPGWEDTVTFALGYLIDPDAESANDANARLKFKGWQILPLAGDP